jgi:hypothetical protein
VEIRGDTAVFTGGPASDLIVARGGGPALVVTKNVLRTVPEFSKATSGAVAYKEVTQGSIVVHFLLGPTRPSLAVPLTWEQLSSIAQEVKVNGIAHKDSKGTEYLETP